MALAMATLALWPLLAVAAAPPGDGANRPEAGAALEGAGPHEPPLADPGPPASEEEVPTVEAEVRVVTNYLWRGYSLSQDAPAAQPWLQLGWKGFEAYGWSTTALDRHPDLDEFAAGLVYGYELNELVTLGAGYHVRVSAGTETEPSTDPDDPLSPSWSGEVQAFAALELEPLSVELTYGRGFQDSVGNSLALWAQASFGTPWEPLSLEPFLQVDYLDQYEPPPTALDRLASVEAGLGFHYRRDELGVLLVGSVVAIPSPHVRQCNLEAGSSAKAAFPYMGLAVAWEGAD